MAQIIQPTPILEGEDAKRFRELTDNVKYSFKKEKFLKKCVELSKKLEN